MLKLVISTFFSEISYFQPADEYLNATIRLRGAGQRDIRVAMHLNGFTIKPSMFTSIYYFTFLQIKKYPHTK